jgi:hypothetical protein
MAIRLLRIEEIWLFEFKQGRIILIKSLQDLGHYGLTHKFGFIPDLIFLAEEVYGFLLPVVE